MVDKSKPKYLQNYLKNSNYSVGNRTYNGTSPSPHAGPGSVNPEGYNTRDNLAKTKRDMLIKMMRQKGR